MTTDTWTRWLVVALVILIAISVVALLITKAVWILLDAIEARVRRVIREEREKDPLVGLANLYVQSLAREQNEHASELAAVLKEVHALSEVVKEMNDPDTPEI